MFARAGGMVIHVKRIAQIPGEAYEYDGFLGGWGVGGGGGKGVMWWCGKRRDVDQRRIYDDRSTYYTL